MNHNLQIHGFQPSMPSIQNSIRSTKNNMRDYNSLGAPYGHFYHFNSNGIENGEDNQKLIYAQVDSMLNTKSHPLDMGYEVQGLHL